MPRRSYASRRLSLESLEVRCNPAALVPMADSLTEPAPVDQPALPDVPAYRLVLDPRVSSAPDKPVQLNAFAGQTVNIPIEAADASTASRPEGGNDWLAGGTGKDVRTGGAHLGKLVVGTDQGVFAGGAGRDVLLGGAGEDLLVGGSTQHAPRGLPGQAGEDLLIGGTTQYAPSGAGFDILIANTGGDRIGVDSGSSLAISGQISDSAGASTGLDDNNHGTHVAGTIGAMGNNGVGVAEDQLSLLSKSQNQNESRSATAGGDYFTGSVTVSGDG
jgi:Subtilase family